MTRAVARSTNFFRAVVETCRRRRPSKAVDSTGQEVSGIELLTRALVLRRLLRRGVLSPDEGQVALLLPPSVGAMVANLALALDRRVTVNLNYTLSAPMLNAGLAEAGIRHIITSRRFAERVPLDLDAEPIYLDDLAERPTRIDKVIAGLQAAALPVGALLRLLGLDRVDENEVMTIVFTSGATGNPKGVMLTYRNIVANLDAVDRVIRWRPTDVLLGALPFFHSFGSTITLWGPLMRDLGVAYHANPLDARGIGALCRAQHATLLATTPMFLRAYLRRGEPADFASLDVVAVGAERLPSDLGDEVARAWGVRPIEGYGTTEMAPLVAANTPPSRSRNDAAATRREGTVGRPVPGARAKVIDPATGAEVGPGERGLLLVTGPSLMKGYLNQPAATAEVVRDGWYVTGDIASIDADGFITLVDRQSRFAKIAGEMIPHAMVEDVLNAALGAGPGAAPNVAVTSIPDPIRGERLVVIHTERDKTTEELQQALVAAGLPNLYIPARDAFVLVDALPVVGAGKIDLQAIRTIALESAASARAS
ncbi:MAG: AMP-binding protein [Thermomicrobiales bacterium]|nr:AMP-binding protein [Thermomicrobiales bacterium]